MEIIDLSQSDELVNVIKKCNLNFHQIARASRQDIDKQSRIDTNNLVIYVDDSIDDALSTLSADVQNMVASKASKSEAISDISRSGDTFTATMADGTTFTFTQKDDDTWVPNTISTDGYVSAPTAQNANRVWKTDGNGNPGWRQESGGDGGGGISLEDVYPIGSIYLNASNGTNPATLLGFGTWDRLGQGRMMIDADSTYTAGDTGGSATHNHNGKSGSTTLSAAQSGLPAHTHGFTNPKIPNHVHTMSHTHPTISLNGGRVVGYNYGSITTGVTATRVTPVTSDNHYVPQVTNADVDFSGFANTGASSATNTGNPTSLGSTTGGAVGAVTDGAKAASSGHDHSISSASNMPPWIGVYMWVRTA